MSLFENDAKNITNDYKVIDDGTYTCIIDAATDFAMERKSGVAATGYRVTFKIQGDKFNNRVISKYFVLSSSSDKEMAFNKEFFTKLLVCVGLVDDKGIARLEDLDHLLDKKVSMKIHKKNPDAYHDAEFNDIGWFNKFKPTDTKSAVVAAVVEDDDGSDIPF